ncbi:MAG: hypothetical protein OHK003_29350 [Anaerolineales bacterium]
MSTDQTIIEKKASTSKKWFLIGGAGFILICACLIIVGVMTVPLLLKTAGLGSGNYSGIASEQLKNDVLAAISNAEVCSTVSLFSGQMMTRPEQSADSSWAELWQVVACNESHLYTISFTPDGIGGTYFSITRTDN